MHTQFRNHAEETLRFIIRFLVHILTEYFVKIIVWFIVGVSDSERGIETMQTHRFQLNGSANMFKSRLVQFFEYYI